MFVPMTELEIADFLETSVERVRMLWSVGLLRRSIACAYRPTHAILHSSPCDVIEYGLASGDLPKRLSCEHASLWVFHLAEAIEEEGFIEGDAATQSSILMRMAEADGLVSLRCDSNEIAQIIVASLQNILKEMLVTDALSFDAYNKG